MKTTRTTIDNVEYEIRRLTPVVGTYIWQKLMQVMYELRQKVTDTADVEQAQPTTETTPAEKLRGICVIAFMHLKFEDFEFIQSNCLKVLSRVENDLPMPLMNTEGKWDSKIYEAIGENLALLNRLTVEALVFSLTSFLD